MKPTQSQAVSKAVFELLEDRQHLSAVQFANGVLTLNGDMQSPDRASVTLIGQSYVVAFTGNQSQVVPLSGIKEIDINVGSKQNTIGVDRALTVPVKITTEGSHDSITKNDPYISVFHVTGSTPPVVTPPVVTPPIVTPPVVTPPVVTPPVVTPPVVTPPVVTPPPVQNSVQAVITAATSTSIVAGQSVSLQAMASALGSDTALTARFHWDFGDNTTGSLYNAVDGFNAGHVYNTPGTYNATLTVTSSTGAVSTVTKQITVGAASTMKTIYVSASGSDSNNGLTPATAVLSTARAQQLIAANTRVLFRAGDTFNMTASLTANYSNVTFSTYGQGASPILKWTGIVGANAMITNVPWVEGLTVQGLTFDSIFSNTTDKSPPTALKVMGTGVTVANNTFLNVDCDVDGSGEPTGLVVVNNVSPSPTGLRCYFCWVQGSDITILGNTVANSTREHIVRIGGANRILIAYNNLTNLDRTKTDSQDIAKSTIAAQIGTYAYIAHNTLSDGPAGVGPLNRADLASNPTYQAESFTWAVFEKNTMNSPFLLQPGAHEISVRGNVCDRDNGAAFIVNGWDANYNRGVQDATFDGNTVIDNATGGYFLDTTGKAVRITLTNNVYIAPNMKFGPGAEPLDIADSDLSSFASISGNIWPAWYNSKAAYGGEMFIGAFWTRGWVTTSQWNSFAQVKNDTFESVTLPANYQDLLSQFTQTGKQLFAAA